VLYLHRLVSLADNVETRIQFVDVNLSYVLFRLSRKAAAVNLDKPSGCLEKIQHWGSVE